MKKFSLDTDKPLQLRHLFIGALLAVAIVATCEGAKAFASAAAQCTREG